jgi:hypothetical protein
MHHERIAKPNKKGILLPPPPPSNTYHGDHWAARLDYSPDTYLAQSIFLT